MQEPRAKEVEITRKYVCLNEECKKDAYVERELDESIEEDDLSLFFFFQGLFLWNE